MRRGVVQHVSDLVVETELETVEEVEIKLPTSLVQLVEKPLAHEADEDRTTAYLLAWMTAFSFFNSAVRLRASLTFGSGEPELTSALLARPQSPRLRTAYIEQLRDSGLVIDSLLPSLFGLLSLSDRGRAFDLAPWSIDDFHLDRAFLPCSPLLSPRGEHD